MKRILIHILWIAIVAGCRMELPQQPLAKFTFDPPAGCQAPCTITFTSESANAASLQWDFNDGSPVEFGNTVKHEFSSGKDYAVKLIVRGTDGGSHGATQTVKITTQAVAQFDYTITSDSIAPATVTFRNQSTNADRYLWDFGDPSSTPSNPNTSEAKDPTHNYTNAGQYQVTLTAYNSGIASAPVQKTIVVKEPIGGIHAFSISGDYNFPTDVVTDVAGSIYVSGTFRGTVNFGNGKTVSSRGLDDFYVVKYSANWQCMWVYSDGSAEDDHANDLELDDKGFLYVTGFVKGSISGGGVTPRGNEDGFVIKLSTLTGESRWISTFGGDGEDQGRALAYNETSTGLRLYLGANVEGNNVTFNTASYTTNEKDFCFAWLNPDNGEITQSILIGGPKVQSIEGLAVDETDNVYMIGGFEGVLSFPSLTHSLTSLGVRNAYAAKWVPATQQFKWSVQIGSANEAFAYDMLVDRQSNVFVTGMHNAFIPALGVGSNGDYNVYVGKWDTNGNKLKGQNGFNDRNDDFTGGIALTPAGNILVSGSYSEEGRFSFFNTDVVSAKGSTDVIISEIDPTELLPTRNFQTSDGGTGEDRAAKVCVTRDGYVYSVGWFYGNATYNKVPLTGNATRNTYIVRYKL